MTSIQDRFATRQLILEGAFNVRDLGGLETGLLEYGLKTVIDLRTSQEILQEPNPFANHEGVRYIHISLFEEIMKNQNTSTMLSLESIYIAALDHCQAAIREVLEVLATSQSVTLFHCTAGKDRTGIVSALLLASAGVPNETITQDYTLTEEYAQPMLERLLREAVKNGVNEDFYAKLLTSKASTMQATLWYLGARFGSIEGYLKDGLGVEGHTLDALRSKMLEG
jgi:protein-tyrosine phosphatase